MQKPSKSLDKNQFFDMHPSRSKPRTHIKTPHPFHNYECVSTSQTCPRGLIWLTSLRFSFSSSNICILLHLSSPKTNSFRGLQDKKYNTPQHIIQHKNPRNILCQVSLHRDFSSLSGNYEPVTRRPQFVFLKQMLHPKKAKKNSPN